MTVRFTLEFWLDDGWYVGRLRQVPGVFSQGQTLEELEENIRDAYHCLHMTDSKRPSHVIRGSKRACGA
jgi:predicted RNase H-like HicB family nuclease